MRYSRSLPRHALVLLFGLVAAGFAAAQADVPETFMRHLEQDEFDQAHAMLDDAAASALSSDRLAQVWRSLPGQLGEYQGRGPERSMVLAGRTISVFRLTFAKAELDARISLTDEARIDGFRIVPAGEPPPAPRAATEGVRELEVKVAGDLPGLLTIPSGEGRFPAVVLVHGSGPNDMNETVGPNRPFLDLARGLSAAGVVVLRYDKRTLVDPGPFQGRAFTVREEVLDDALAALSLLRRRDEVDPERLFVVGHSLGGLLGPRIALDDGRLRGLALLAAPARPLEDIVVDQVRYIAGLDGEIDDQEQAQIDELQRAADAVDALDDPESATPAMLGLPQSYWVDLSARDPIDDANLFLETGDAALLVAQGGRDYQVTEADDYRRWRAAFENHPRAVLRLYPELNHLFIAGEGMATPEEYMQRPGQVDEALIRDLIAFVLEPPE